MSKAAQPKSKRARKQKPAPAVPLGDSDRALKLTLPQEQFCEYYIENGGNASEAYRTAYPNARRWKPEAVWVAASQLLARNKVSIRIDEMRTQIRKRHEITVDDIVAELEEARAVALKNDTASAMVAASVAKAKLLGLVVDKSEISGKGGQPLHPAQIAPTPRETARVILSILREANVENQDTPGSPKSANTSDAEIYRFDPRSRKLGAA